jgi:trans-2,3-dihydro-3-hydroxyanthranilate isomerase
MFAPTDGVPEDPATGSAAGPLACHVARYGLGPFDETIVIAQGDELGRPSTLHAKVAGTPDRITSVAVGGIVQLLGSGEVAW